MWVWASFLPHPPIIVPEVGKGHEREAQKTLEGVSALTSRIKDLMPEVLLVLSPHQPWDRGFCLTAAARYFGDFSSFGAPSVRLDLKGAPLKAEKLRNHLAGTIKKLRFTKVEEWPLDHASMVPLYFFKKIWGALPPVILSNPVGMTPQEAALLGKTLSSFQDDAKWALLASGDLSHRLFVGAPAGYSPDGKIFDEAVVRAFTSSDLEMLLSIDPDVVENAGECGYRSAVAFLALAGEGPVQVFSYEGPFGVGYCTALWVNEPSAQNKEREEKHTMPTHPYPRLARKTLETFLTERRIPTWQEIHEICDDDHLWERKKACFVSIHKKNGELRGCIGTLEPATPSIAYEIISNAISAATRDPRFPPIEQRELPDLTLSVDVLSDPEEISNLNDLDPKKYGVIVTKGHRRGVLLPDLEGVDTIEQQLSIALQKAGLRSLDGVSIARFTVERHSEEG